MTEERQVGAGVVEPEVTDEPVSAPRLPAAAPAGDASLARRRPRALRIPDDEVARPAQSAAHEALEDETELPHAPVPDVVLTPTRIITISPPQEPAPQAVIAAVPAPPTLPNLIVDEDEDEDDSEVTQPGSEREPPPSVPPEDVEVRFEDDVPDAPRSGVDVALISDGERRSEPGDAPEVEAEDVVTVEPPRVAAVVPPVRSMVPSQPAVSARPAPPARPAAPPTRPPPLVIVPPHVGSIPAGPAADGAGVRRKARLWWEELFNDDYLHAMERITDEQIAREVHFIEESLGVEGGGALLDLACGTGRHAVELARRGYEVVGFDLSLAMLARAGEDAQERETKLNFMQGDMREMTFEEQFDGVYCWNTSFGYFDEDKNAQVVDRVHRALKGGGLFLLDVVNRDFVVRQSPSLAWFEGEGCVCMDDMSVDFITSRLRVKRTMMLDDGRSREIEYSMRIYSLHELGRILHEHGFKVREVSGRASTPGVFFGSDSPRSIILAEKR
jgi:SAM-dependent methyltransferase